MSNKTPVSFVGNWSFFHSKNSSNGGAVKLLKGRCGEDVVVVVATNEEQYQCEGIFLTCSNKNCCNKFDCRKAHYFHSLKWDKTGKSIAPLWEEI
jgi:hypothetical protein